MTSIEKLETLKQQEVFLKDFIQKLENQKARLEIETNELKMFIRFLFLFFIFDNSI
jgi:hypothetical protein